MDKVVNPKLKSGILYISGVKIGNIKNVDIKNGNAEFKIRVDKDIEKKFYGKFKQDIANGVVTLGFEMD